jgi:hypothetical protein
MNHTVLKDVNEVQYSTTVARLRGTTGSTVEVLDD